MKVKFTYSQSDIHIGRLFNQPLFYLSENIKQLILKRQNSKKFINERCDSNFEIDLDNENIEFNMLSYNKETFKNCKEELNDTNNINENTSDIKNETSTGISYILDNLSKDMAISFKYSNINFKLEITDVCKDRPIKENMYSEYTLYSTYQISFPTDALEVFEKFIQTTIQYSYKFNNNIIYNDNKLSLYLSRDDGGYFQFIGRREKRKLETIHIPKKIKNDLLNDLENFLKPETKTQYLNLGINYKRTYLFEGYPGTGKTSLIMALASYFNYNIAIVSFTPKMTDSDLFHLIRSIDSKDEDFKKIFIIFEDIDCIFKERKSHDEQRNCVSFSGLLNALDGFATAENMITFITTNYINNLDNALLRPGRVDYILSFEYANKEQITGMFKAFTLCDNSKTILEFYDLCCNLNINITTSLLQQYLMKYINNPQNAIDNIDEMKKLHDKSKANKEDDDKGLYS